MNNAVLMSHEATGSQLYEYRHQPWASLKLLHAVTRRSNAPFSVASARPSTTAVKTCERCSVAAGNRSRAMSVTSRIELDPPTRITLPISSALNPASASVSAAARRRSAPNPRIARWSESGESGAAGRAR